MISWLTLPAVLRQNERVHSDGSSRRCENSCHKSVRAAPLDEPGNVRRQRVRSGPDEHVDMMGLDRHLDDLPIVCIWHLVNDRLQTVMYWPDKHPPTPPGTPDDVVHERWTLCCSCWYSTWRLHPSSTVSASRKGHSSPG